MKTTVHFSKLSAAGNDFILIDNRESVLPQELSPLVKKWCHRKFSVGADGLITLEKSDNHDFRMRYFNADGSPAAMCGNGARSIARFAWLLNAAPKKMAFETDAGIIHAEILGSTVRLRMSEPKDARLDFTVSDEKREFSVSFIDTGVPHVVIPVNNADKTDVVEIGRMVRYHREFSPAGTNVNFIQKKDDHTLIVRTYERGVEDETLACGTGCTASAIIAGMKGLVTSPVDCITRGGDVLKIAYTLNGAPDMLSPVSNVYLEGPAEVTFTGELVIGG
jgi:diaminopimelate epimerase